MKTTHPSIARSKNMSAIRSKDTSIEVRIRSVLFRKGFRFRKNLRNLPGTPDIVFPKKKIAIFLDGCFWHGHKDCRNGVIPKTNHEFWEKKISENKCRDKKNRSTLREMGYIVLEYWECQIKDNQHQIVNTIAKTLTN